MLELYEKLLTNYRRECQTTGALKGLIDRMLRYFEACGDTVVCAQLREDYEYIKKAFGDEE